MELERSDLCHESVYKDPWLDCGRLANTVVMNRRKGKDLALRGVYGTDR